MATSLRIVTLASCSFCLFFGVAYGQKATIEADITGVDGLPSRSAQVRLERQGTKTAATLVKADRHGHLSVSNLAVGTYKVTATVEGGVQSSQMVRTQANKPSVVTFDMRKSAAMANAGSSSNKKKNLVWVPPQTGSRIGGHWAEAGRKVERSESGAQNVDTLNGGDAIERIDRQTNVPPRAQGGL